MKSPVRLSFSLFLAAAPCLAAAPVRFHRPTVASSLARHVRAAQPFAGRPSEMADAVDRSIRAQGGAEERLAGQYLLDALNTGRLDRVQALLADAPGGVSLDEVAGLSASLQTVGSRQAFQASAAPIQEGLAAALRAGSVEELGALLDGLFSGAEGRDPLAVETPAAMPEVGFSGTERAAPAPPGFGRLAPSPRGRGPAIFRSKYAKQVFALGEALRRRGLDPVTGHVPEITALIEEHLGFARKAIGGKDAERLADLRAFAREARRRGRRGPASYQWWHDFNYRLAILMTPEAERTTATGGSKSAFGEELLASGAWRTDEGFRAAAAGYSGPETDFRPVDVAASFPRRLVIPVLEGELPIEDMNALYGLKLDVMGLIGGFVRADGRTMYSDHFARHDHVHAANDQFYTTDLSDEQLRSLREDYLAHRATLSGERRKAFEFGYYLATHELSIAPQLLYGGPYFARAEAMLLGYIRDSSWYAALVPRWAILDYAGAGRFLAMAEAELGAFKPRR